ncbi:hypothetical protein [Providencia manganoxydans]|uniref:hypothetical protein n=1 Tax=Providencia manganoxydans TaxID=2923283 RepID=UPI0034E4E19A
MMENHKEITFDELNNELLPVIGGTIELLNFVGFSEKDCFKIIKKVDGWESKTDIDLLMEIEPEKYLSNEVIVLNDMFFYDKFALLVQLEKIKVFLLDYFSEYHESFFNGDVLFISILNKKLLQFNHDGYLIIYDLPIKLIEKGFDKYMKSKYKL